MLLSFCSKCWLSWMYESIHFTNGCNIKSINTLSFSVGAFILFTIGLVENLSLCSLGNTLKDASLEFSLIKLLRNFLDMLLLFDSSSSLSVILVSISKSGLSSTSMKFFVSSKCACVVLVLSFTCVLF